jgi:hypothetical protein
VKRRVSHRETPEREVQRRVSPRETPRFTLPFTLRTAALRTVTRQSRPLPQSRHAPCPCATAAAPPQPSRLAAAASALSTQSPPARTFAPRCRCCTGRPPLAPALPPPLALHFGRHFSRLDVSAPVPPSRKRRERTGAGAGGKK